MHLLSAAQSNVVSEKGASFGLRKDQWNSLLGSSCAICPRAAELELGNKKKRYLVIISTSLDVHATLDY